MKAVIMAGGEGTRLRPLSLGRPKPMTPLLGKPVLEHIIRLLKKYGADDICITLCYKPQAVMDYFGGGERLGVRLTYFVEEDPLGTAGSVKRCAPHLGSEPFLVISGDCVCDLDLGALVRFHREKDAAATLALYAHPSPTEYGLVLTDGEGRIRRFVEKPSWGQVVTDRINTGIYLLSPAVLERVPEERSFDFGRDLFPALLSAGAPLYGCPLKGYWCDMGDSGAYLACVRDALSGRLDLDLGPQRSPGVWSVEEPPGDVTLIPPVWLGEGVSLASGCRVGPHTALDRGARVGEGAEVRRSVLLESAFAGDKTVLDGAILCRDAAVRRGAVLQAGAVLGENALAEEGAVLLENVKLWPGQTAPAECRLARSITSGSQKGVLRFGSCGSIQGVLGEDLGPEALLALSSVLGAEGRVGLGRSDSPGAGLLAQAALAGISAAGGQAVLLDLPAPVQGAWAARELALPVSLYVEEEGGLAYLHLFDALGLPLGRARERKLEHAVAQGEFRRVRGDQLKDPQRSDLTEGRWAEETASRARLGPALRRVTAAVGRDCPADRAVRAVLEALGCKLEEDWRPGIVAFAAGHGGFRLTARDERGALLDAGQLLTLAALIELENGGGQVAVPPEASAAVDLVAAGYGGAALRLDRDGEEARRLYASLPWLWSAPAAAARICARMGASGQKLEALMSKTPRFSAWRREVPLSAGRGQVMRALADENRGGSQEEGVRFRTGNGWVSMTPLPRRSALRIVAEGPDLELAAELCDFYAGRAARLDRSISEQSSQGGDKK